MDTKINNISKQTFTELMENLNIDYIAYMRTDINGIVNFCYNSYPEWRDIFIEENLYVNCPLMKLAKNINNNGIFYFEWKDVPVQTKNEKEVYEARNDYKIYRGCSIVKRKNNIKYLLGVGRSINDDSYFEERIRNNYKNLLYYFICLEHNIYNIA